MRRTVAVASIVTFLGATAGCGTILYPERRGQSSGQLDADIVILDAVGLLFYLVPGVIAFAVDFSTGAIYLPKGQKSKTSEILGQVEIERHELPSRSIEAIETALREHAGLSIELLTDARRIGAPTTDDSVEAQVRALNQRFLTRDARSEAPRVAAASL